MHFPSGILLYKNLPIYSMVNQISFCFRTSIFFFMFLSDKSEKLPSIYSMWKQVLFWLCFYQAAYALSFWHSPAQKPSYL